MKKIMVMFAEGNEEVEALTPVDLFRRVGEHVDIVSVTDDLIITSSHGVDIMATTTLEKLKKEEYDAIIIPGGLTGATSLKDNERVLDLIRYMNESGKVVAAICAGPIVLEAAGVLKGKNITSYPGFEKSFEDAHYHEDTVVIDGNIVTSRGPATAMQFGAALVEKLCGAETADKLRKQLLLA